MKHYLLAPAQVAKIDIKHAIKITSSRRYYSL